MKSAPKKRRKKKPTFTVRTVPPFVQISVAPNPLGEAIYGLDAAGRIWFSLNEDEACTGWELVDNEIWSPK